MANRELSRRAGTLALALLLAVSIGCVIVHEDARPRPKVVVKTVPKKGPPAHAKAHGYHKKHGHPQAEVVFDTRRGIYIVLGLPNHFWDGKHYYRLVGHKWQWSADLDGRWVKVKKRDLPRGLRGDVVPASPSRLD